MVPRPNPNLREPPLTLAVWDVEAGPAEGDAMDSIGYEGGVVVIYTASVASSEVALRAEPVSVMS